jgi:hypothetical protein
VRVRNLIMAAAAFLAFTNPAAATRWKMAWSRPGPAPNVRGCSYTAFVLTDGTPPRVWPVLETGYGTPVPLNVPRGAWGLEWYVDSGGWVSNYNNSYIYRLTATGSVVSSFRCPRPHPAGMAVRTVPYGDIAVALPLENLILFLTDTGSIVRSERGPGTSITAISYNSRRSCLGDAGTHKVFTWDGTFDVPAVGGLAPEASMSEPYKVILLTDTATNAVQLWVYSGPRPFVAPNSFGRVKALFQ